MEYYIVFKKEILPCVTWGLPGGSVVKNLPAYAGDMGSIPGLGRTPGEGNGNTLQYPFLENPMDIRAWGTTVHEVAESRTWLSMHACIVHPMCNNMDEPGGHYIKWNKSDTEGWILHDFAYMKHSIEAE